ncbi:hypothetical protein D3C86_1149640 [compost metagenome]
MFECSGSKPSKRQSTNDGYVESRAAALGRLPPMSSPAVAAESPAQAKLDGFPPSLIERPSRIGYPCCNAASIFLPGMRLQHPDELLYFSRKFKTGKPEDGGPAARNRRHRRAAGLRAGLASIDDDVLPLDDMRKLIDLVPDARGQFLRIAHDDDTLRTE